MTELLGSDFTLIDAVFAGLALTSLGILHDLGPFRPDQAQSAKVAIQDRRPADDSFVNA